MRKIFTRGHKESEIKWKEKEISGYKNQWGSTASLHTDNVLMLSEGL